MDSLRKQYRESEKIRRGVDSVLKSKNFTEEYKSKIKNFIDSPEPDILPDDKEVILAKEGQAENEIIIATYEGGVAGWVERPIYISTEVERATDTIVTELIPSPPEQRDPTVPKQVYDDAVNDISNLTRELNQAKNQADSNQSEVQKLKGEIQALLQALDAERLKAAVAANEADSSDSRYRSLLSEFQSAIQKGIQESVARVSLEAQVRGLQAQKETLMALLDSAKEQLATFRDIIDVLKGTIQTQQNQLDQQAQQIEQQQDRIEEQQEEIINDDERNAAIAAVMTGIPNSFAQGVNSGWKVPQSQIKEPSLPLYIEVWTVNDQNDIRKRPPTELNFYNFSEEPQTFSVSTNVNWLKAGTPITIPPRSGATAGRGYVGLQWGRAGATDDGRKDLIPGRITVNVSPSGEVFQINAGYWKEVARANRVFTIGGLVKVPGGEIN